MSLHTPKYPHLREPLQNQPPLALYGYFLFLLLLCSTRIENWKAFGNLIGFISTVVKKMNYEHAKGYIEKPRSSADTLRLIEI